MILSHRIKLSEGAVCYHSYKKIGGKLMCGWDDRKKPCLRAKCQNIPKASDVLIEHLTRGER